MSENLSKPIYLVGGSVRNFLIDGSLSTDIDLAAAVSVDEVIDVAQKIGIEIIATYKRTSTVVLKADGEKAEYTAFRREEYKEGGEHTPIAVYFTESITEDAKRRDFKCNAVYYDIKNDKIVDPLGGVEDIKSKRISTVDEPKKVFSHDGLRLMRLARFAGELNFTPTSETLESAKEYADNIKDISPERIFDELKKILIADKKYSFSDKKGHYTALKILDQIRVLDRIIPELTLGRGMAQRKDFHNYDVLEHSLRSVLYSSPKVRLAALVHDIGKPYCMLNNGVYYGHDKEGAKIACEVLRRLKADNESIKRAVFLTREHMLDLDGKMRESKVKRYVVENFDCLEELFMIKQADFSACKDDLATAHTIIKWKNIMEKMRISGVPTSYKELKISANDLVELGFKGRGIGDGMKTILYHVIENPEDNDSGKLLAFAKKMIERR